MVGRGELTGSAWAAIEPLLPRKGARRRESHPHDVIITKEAPTTRPAASDLAYSS